VVLIVELDRLAEQRDRVVQPALDARSHAVRVQRGQAVEQDGHGVHRAIGHRRNDLAQSDAEGKCGPRWFTPAAAARRTCATIAV